MWKYTKDVNEKNTEQISKKWNSQNKKVEIKIKKRKKI